MRCDGGDGRVWWRSDTLILRVAITIELQLYRGNKSVYSYCYRLKVQSLSPTKLTVLFIASA